MPESGVSDYDGLILDGAIRSGKTVPESVSYIDWGMHSFTNENFGMAGFTLGALRRNVIGPLKRTLPGRGYQVKDFRSSSEPRLEISKGSRTNYFYLFGGNNERSQDPVLGFTGAGFYFDQVELMPRSFVETAEGRCSVDGSKLWYNCNPQGPQHWFYLDYLQKLEEKNLLHLHFLMSDNPGLSRNTIKRYERRWPKTSVFYLRNVAGLWVMAEGLIYDFFTTSPSDGYVVSEIPGDLQSWIIGADYGTTNPTTWILAGYSPSLREWVVTSEYWWSSRETRRQKTDREYTDDLTTFLGERNNPLLRAVMVDPAAASWIADMRKARMESPKYGYVQHVRGADNSVLDGIRDAMTLLHTHKVRIYGPGCPHLVEGLQGYLWDEKAAEKGEDRPLKDGGSNYNDHSCDAFRYLCREVKRLGY